MKADCPHATHRRWLIGVWLSLVERTVRDREVAGSNPVTPTSAAATGGGEKAGSLRACFFCCYRCLIPFLSDKLGREVVAHDCVVDSDAGRRLDGLGPRTRRPRIGSHRPAVLTNRRRLTVLAAVGLLLVFAGSAPPTRGAASQTALPDDAPARFPSARCWNSWKRGPSSGPTRTCCPSSKPLRSVGAASGGRIRKSRASAGDRSQCDGRAARATSWTDLRHGCIWPD